MKTRKIDEATRQAAWDELVRIIIRGGTQQYAAEQLGFNVKTIQSWMGKPEFKLKLQRTKALIFEKSRNVVDEIVEEKKEDLAKNIEATIEKYSVLGVRKIKTLMERSKTEGIQLKAAIDLADRGPRTMKTKKTMNAHLHAIFTPEALVQAAKVAAEALEDEPFGRKVEAVELEPVMGEPLDEER